MRNEVPKALWAIVLMIVLVLASCGGGGGSNQPIPPAEDTTFLLPSGGGAMFPAGSFDETTEVVVSEELAKGALATTSFPAGSGKLLGATVVTVPAGVTLRKDIHVLIALSDDVDITKQYIVFQYNPGTGMWETTEAGAAASRNISAVGVVEFGNVLHVLAATTGVSGLNETYGVFENLNEDIPDDTPPPPPPNHIPEVGLVASATTVIVNTPVNLTATGDDEDLDDTLTFGWLTPGGTAGTPATANRVCTMTWQAAEPGTYGVTVSVDDGNGGIDTAAVEIIVNAAPRPNDPPVFTGDPGAEIAKDVAAPVTTQKVMFTATATDPDLDPVTITWSDSTGGTNFETPVFDEATGKSSVLWSYDTVGAATITATAEDGFGGSTSVTFDVTLTDLPTTFDWMGKDYCAMCHPDQATAYETTGHANARQTLVDYGRGRTQYCMPCHDVGFNAGGFIDLDLTPQYANVQCENCHGTGVGHPANGPRPIPWNPKTGYKMDANGVLETDVDGNYIWDAAYDGSQGYGCGKCHTGSRHGAFPEWAKSGHALQEKAPFVEDDGTGTMVVGPPGEINCVKCHNGQWFVKIQIDGEDPPAEELLPEDLTDDMHIVCATCHDPHEKKYESQLRVDSAGTVTIPFDESGPAGTGTVVSAGKANTCLMCHNGRRTFTDRANQLNGSSNPRGFHGNSQGPTLYGIGGYEFPGYYYDKEHPHNTWNENKCVTCHMYTREYDPATQSPKIWGHDWEPAWESCATCHPQVTDEASYEAFKGELQAEIQALLDEFVSLWPAPWKDVSDPANPILTARDTEPPTGVGPARDDPTKGDLYRAAYWNYKYVTAEASHGVHNPDYEKQLLESAIAELEVLNAMP